jgi:hypothetical protein
MADWRSFGDLVPGDHLGDLAVVAFKLVPYDGDFTYDILPATSTGFYFTGGALIGTTLVERPAPASL